MKVIVDEPLIGSSSLTRTSISGVSGLRLPSDWSFSSRSVGRMIAPRTSPDSTISRASSRVSTSTQSTFAQSSSLASPMSKSSPPMATGVSAESSSTKATFGVDGPRESAKPIRTAITIG